MSMENPDELSVRDIRFPELVYRASENGIDSLDEIMGQMEEEAISYLQDETRTRRF